MNTDEKKGPSSKMFWDAFLLEKDRLYEMIFSDDFYAAYQRIGKLLAFADYSHVYEVTCDDNAALLIFTPESDSEIATIVDAFVEKAPVIPGWKVLNRRQRKTVEDAIAMLEEVYEVELQDIGFSIEETRSGLNVIMYTTTADILEEREKEGHTRVKEGFLSFFLEHALGEEVSMSLIRERYVQHPDHSIKLMEPHVFVTAILEIAIRQGIIPQEKTI